VFYFHSTITSLNPASLSLSSSSSSSSPSISSSFSSDVLPTSGVISTSFGRRKIPEESAPTDHRRSFLLQLGVFIFFLIYALIIRSTKVAFHSFFLERDPSISHPYDVTDSVPSWLLYFVATFIPGIIVLIYILLPSCLIPLTRKDRFHYGIWLGLGIFQTLVIVVSIFFTMKVATGRLRPNFLLTVIMQVIERRWIVVIILIIIITLLLMPLVTWPNARVPRSMWMMHKNLFQADMPPSLSAVWCTPCIYYGLWWWWKKETGLAFGMSWPILLCISPLGSLSHASKMANISHRTLSEVHSLESLLQPSFGQRQRII